MAAVALQMYFLNKKTWKLGLLDNLQAAEWMLC